MRFIFIFVLSLLPHSSFATFILAEGKWQSYHTEHFEIIYPEAQKKLAEIYGAASEKAFEVLSPVFGEPPSQKIPVILADVIDTPNGMATFYPYPRIVIFPTMPLTTDSVSHYENWIFEIMLHEIAHIFSFVPAHGFYTPFKYLIGNVVRPAALVPRWYLEGLAVELESRYTTHGRLRSPGTAAAFRALVADDSLLNERLDRINEVDIPTWPYGQRPYLYGSLLWHRLVEDEGIGAVSDFSQRHGRRVPFFLNAPMEERTGQNWPERWTAMKTSLTTELTAQLEQIRAKGEMDFVPVIPAEGQQNAPVISPDGRHLAFINWSPFTGSTVQVISRGEDEIKSFSKLKRRTLMQVASPTRVAWLPDSKSLVVDQLHIVRRGFRIRDLYLVSLDDSPPTQITSEQRAMEPAVSPSGKQVAFVRNLAGRTELAVLNRDTGKVHTYFRPKLGLRLAQPEFLDEKKLIYLGRDYKGVDRIYQLDLKTSKRAPYATAMKDVATLRKNAKGLLMTSAKSGTNNLYLYTPSNGKMAALTNSQTEAIGGDIDTRTNELITIHASSQGRQLIASSFRTYEPPVLSTPASLKFDSAPPAPLNLASLSGKHDGYSPWRYMIPKYWVPFIYPLEDGIIFQGSTEVFDPTGRHHYLLQGSYDTVTDLSGYGFSYLLSSKDVQWMATIAQSNQLLTAGDDPLTDNLLGLGATFYLPGLNNSWRGGLQASHIDTEVPGATATTQLRRAGPTVQLNYDSGANHVFKSKRGDFAGTIAHTHFVRADDYFDYDRTFGAVAGKWRGPFPDRHALGAEIKAAYAPKLATMGQVRVLGDRTIGGNYLVSLINSTQKLRGYPSGALTGRTLINANIDYTFPLWDIFRGKNLFPWFSRSLQMGFFIDGAIADGLYYSPETESYGRARTDDIFGGAGMEFHLMNTFAYHLPVSITLGLYYGFDERAGGGFTPFLSIGYEGHSGVDHSPSTETQFRPASFAR